jgi:hypothetical protein
MAIPMGGVMWSKRSKNMMRIKSKRMTNVLIMTIPMRMTYYV